MDPHGGSSSPLSSAPSSIRSSPPSARVTGSTTEASQSVLALELAPELAAPSELSPEQSQAPVEPTHPPYPQKPETKTKSKPRTYSKPRTKSTFKENPEPKMKREPRKRLKTLKSRETEEQSQPEQSQQPQQPPQVQPREPTPVSTKALPPGQEPAFTVDVRSAPTVLELPDARPPKKMGGRPKKTESKDKLEPNPEPKKRGRPRTIKPKEKPEPNLEPKPETESKTDPETKQEPKENSKPTTKRERKKPEPEPEPEPGEQVQPEQSPQPTQAELREPTPVLNGDLVARIVPAPEKLATAPAALEHPDAPQVTKSPEVSDAPAAITATSATSTKPLPLAEADMMEVPQIQTNHVSAVTPTQSRRQGSQPAEGRDEFKTVFEAVQRSPTFDKKRDLEREAHEADETPKTGGPAKRRRTIKPKNISKHTTRPNPGVSASAKKKAIPKKWQPNFVTQDSKSPLAKTNIRAVLTNPRAWASLTPEDRQEILAKFPSQQHILDPDTPKARPNISSLLSDDSFRYDTARYAEQITDGRHNPHWLHEAWTAHERNLAGEFAEFEVNLFESEWGVKLPEEMKGGGVDRERERMKSRKNGVVLGVEGGGGDGGDVVMKVDGVNGVEERQKENGDVEMRDVDGEVGGDEEEKVEPPRSQEQDVSEVSSTKGISGGVERLTTESDMAY